MWQLCLPAQRGVYISTKGLKKFHCTAEFPFCDQRNFISRWNAFARELRKMLEVFVLTQVEILQCGVCRCG